MLIPVPRKDTYDVEPGRYRAICTEAREIHKMTSKGSQRQLRVIWELETSGDDDLRYLVGKSYEATLTSNSQLRNDLRTWLGHEFKPGQFDTATLKGKAATITVEHIWNEGWAKPYCWVAKVEPPFDPGDISDCEGTRGTEASEQID